MYKKLIAVFLFIAGLSLLGSCGGNKKGCRPKRGLYSKIEQANFHNVESDLVLLDKPGK